MGPKPQHFVKLLLLVLLAVLHLCQHSQQLLLGVLGGGGLCGGLGLGCGVGEELDHDGEIAVEVQPTVDGGLFGVRVNLSLGQFDDLHRGNLAIVGGGIRHVLHEIIVPVIKGFGGGEVVGLLLCQGGDAGAGGEHIKHHGLFTFLVDPGIVGELPQGFLGGIVGDFAFLQGGVYGFGVDGGQFGEFGGGHSLKFGMCGLVVVHLASVGEGIGILAGDSEDGGGVVSNGLEAVGLVGFLVGHVGENFGNLTIFGVGVLGGVGVNCGDTLGCLG